MSIQGKGFYIWRIPYTEGGDNDKIVQVAKEANLGHVLIKVANGQLTYNYDRERHIDLVAPLVRRLREIGVTVWGWQYIFGHDPVAEARMAIQRIRELDLPGFVVNAEKEFKVSGMATVARRYMKELRNAFPDLPIALSSYRFPSYHPQFPFAAFLEYCDWNMPQVYWVGAHNPAAQLIKSVREFQSINPNRPIIPTGAAYPYDNWKPAPEDIVNFLQTCRELNLPAANFWSWEHCRRFLQPAYEALRDFSWEVDPGPPVVDIAEKYIDALNTGDPLNPVLLYTLTGVHVDSKNTLKGPEKLLAWYNNFLNNTLPNATFELTGLSGTGNSRHFTWKADSPQGSVPVGNNTVGLKDGKIAYHYTYFQVVPK